MLNQFFRSLFACFFCLAATPAFAQTSVTITEGTSLILPCTTMCFTLHTTATAPASSDIYTVDPIPYSSTVLAAPTVLSLPDDTFSNAIPIGFSFCYFNQSFTNLYVSPNGIITFNTLFANSAFSFTTTQAIPYTSSTFPSNAICCPFADMKSNATSSIRYKTIGTAPNRKFVVQYVQMPLFGSGCSAGTNTFEVVLMETSNKIQMHITSKVTCNASTTGFANYATLGIQGGSPLAYKAVLGRNASIWTDSNKAWEYKPIGQNNYNIQWINMANGAILNPSSDMLTYCASVLPMQIKAKITLPCGIDSAIDIITVDSNHAVINNLIITPPTCKYDCNGSITVKASSAFLPMKYGLSHAYNGLYNMFYDSVFNNLCRDSVYIHIKDNYGCRHDSVFFLNSRSNLGVGLSQNPLAICWLANGGLLASAYSGVAPISYLWSNGDTTNAVTGFVGGTWFTVTATDSLNCVATSSAPIGINLPKANFISLHIPECYDSSGMVVAYPFDGFGGPYTLLWNTGSTSDTLFNMIPFVTYTLTITDVNGCIGVALVSLTPNNLPLVSTINITKPTCGYANGSITVSAYNGTPPYTYTWSNSCTTAYNGNISAGMYSLNIRDAKNCPMITTYSKLLIDTLQMLLAPTSANTTCNLPNGQAATNPNNGMAPYTYLWSNGSTIAALGSLLPGTYTCAVRDAFDCRDTASFTILPSLPLVLSLTRKNANCDSANGALLAVPTNAIGGVTYLWSTAATANPLNNLWPGFYSCTATDASGCTANSFASLFDEGSPSIYAISFDPPLCYGDTSGVVTLGGLAGTAPYKYSVDGINYGPNPVVNNIAAGTYKLYIKDANSCIRDTLLTFIDAVQIDYTTTPIDTLVCFNDKIDSIIIKASGGLGYHLFSFNGIDYTTDSVMRNLGIGTHTFSIKDSVNCVRNFELEIYGPADTLTNQTNKYNVPCYATNTGFLHPQVAGGWPPYTYLWNDSIKTANRDSLQVGKYYLYITDRRGCKIETAEVILTDKCCEMFVPNVFSPNGDLLNDDVVLKNRGQIESIQFAIYDRWGQQLFTTTDANVRWNGTYKGAPMPMETYFYSLKLKCISQESLLYKNGEIILIR
jgi:gliding motility-associated-like protein